MPLDDTQIREIKGQMAAARKRDISFGICFGKKPAETVIVMHRIKEPDFLAKQAKREGNTAKVAFGTMRVDGKKLLLTVFEDPPASSARNAKLFLREIGVPMKVQILDRDGQLLEDDGDDDDGEGPEKEAAAADTDPDPLAAKWQAVYAKLDAVVAQAASAGLGDPSKFRAAWAYACGNADEGDFPGALKVAARLAAAIEAAKAAGGAGDGPPPGDDDPGAAPSVDMDRRKWELGSKKIEPFVKQALEKGTGDPDELRAAWAWAHGKAEDNKFAEAVKALSRIAKLITEARESGVTPAQAATKDMQDSAETRAQLLAAQWGDGLAAITERIEAALQLKLADAAKLEAVWKIALQKAGEGDHATAIKARKGAEQLAASLTKRAAEMAMAWTRDSAALSDTVKAGLAANASNRQRLDAVWKMAHEKAVAASHEEALQLLDQVRALAAAAVDGSADAAGQEAGDGPAEASKTVAETREALKDDAELSVALAKAQALADGEFKALTDLVKAFGDGAPAAWATQIGAIEKGFETVNRLDGLAAITTGTERLKAAIEALELAVREMTALRRDWTDSWALYEIRRDALMAHPSAADNVVKTPMDALIAEADKAKARSDKGEYAEAIDDLKVVVAKFDALEKLADDYGHYKVVSDRRKEVIGTLILAGLPEAVAELEAATKCVPNANKEAAKKDFVKALEILNEIPKRIDKAKYIESAAKEYKDHLAKYKVGKFDPVDTADAKYKDLLAAELGHLRGTYNAGKAAEDNGDWIKAAAIVSEVWPAAIALESSFAAVKDYVDKRALFDPEYEKIKDHDGKNGILEFHARVISDQAFIEARKLAGEFTAAVKVMDAVQPLFAEQLALAEKYKTYKEKKDETEEKIAKIREKKPDGVDSAELAKADQHLELMRAKETNQKFDDAETELNKALACAEQAKTIFERQKQLDDLLPETPAEPDPVPVPDPVPDGDDAEAAAATAEAEAKARAVAALKARVAALEQMRAQVKTAAAGDSFDPLITPVDAPIEQAKTALDGPTPDTDAISSGLDSIPNTLKAAMGQILRKPSYDASLAAIEPRAADPGGELQTQSTAHDNCINDEIDKIRTAIQAAKDAAETPKLDFGAGEQKLAEATILAQRALEKVTVFAELKDDRAKIETLRTYLLSDWCKDGTTTEVARLAQIQQNIKTQLDAFAFPAARKLVKKGVDLDAPYREIAKHYHWAVGRKTEYYDDYRDNAESKPACQIENTQLEAKKIEVQALFDKHAYKGAFDCLEQFGWITNLAKSMVTRHDAYVAERDPVKARYDLLEPRRNAHVADLLDEAKTLLAQGETQVGQRSFEQAKTSVAGAKKVLDQIDTLIPDTEAYEVARTAAEAKITETDKPDENAAIEPLILRIKAKFANAGDLAKRGKFTDATALLGQIAGDCDAAVVARDGHAAFAALVEPADGTAPDPGDIQQAIETVAAKIAELKGKPLDGFLPGSLVSADQSLDAAKTAFKADPQQSLPPVKEASDYCASAEMTLVHMGQLKTESETAIAMLDGFTSGGHTSKDFVAPRMAVTRKRIEDALKEAYGSGKHDAASKALVDAIAAYRANVALADAHKEYTKLRKTFEPDGGDTVLKTLLEDAHRYAVTDQINLIRQKLAEADAATKAKEPDMTAAMTALKAADAAAAVARLTVSMLDNTAAPSKEDVRKVLEGTDGDDALDKIVQQLDPAARRDVLRAAIEVRFGCELKIFQGIPNTGATTPDGDELGPNVQQFYENLRKLPKKHTLGNDSLLVIQDERSATGGRPGEASDFLEGDKAIRMREGAAVTSAGRMLGSEIAVGAWDVSDLPDDHPDRAADPDDFKLTNNDPVQYFGWNTLHEVGHSVDDKYGFMDGKLGQSLFGGWENFGRDVSWVAEIVGGHFDYDKSYTAELLTGVADPPIPDAPDGVKPDVWEQRRIQVRSWANNAKSGNNPWETNSTAMALAVKHNGADFIIHEAYSGLWVGHLASERKKGVTGYQFRAPGEWFSEIYAAYYSGKLKESHPAAGWLKALETA